MLKKNVVCTGSLVEESIVFHTEFEDSCMLTFSNRTILNYVCEVVELIDNPYGAYKCLEDGSYELLNKFETIERIRD